MSTKKLATLRGQIETLSAERGDTADAPITREEAAARFDHLIAGVRDDWTHGSVPQGLADGSIIERTLAEWLGRPAAMCALFPDVIRDCLLKHYDDQTAGATLGLPMAERREKLSALDAEIYTLEQEEEHLIEVLEEQGHDIQRRPDADPAAALGLPPGREAA